MFVVIGPSFCSTVFPTDLYEDGDHSDAMRALSCLSVIGIQVLVVMDQLDLKERHETHDMKHYNMNESDKLFSTTLYGCCNKVFIFIKTTIRGPITPEIHTANIICASLQSMSS